MKRYLLVIVPWMVLATSARGQTRSADVLYTHFSDTPTRALRIGDECFVAFEDTVRWGWTCDPWADTVSVKAEGKAFAIQYKNLNGRKYLPLIASIQKLGGEAEWIDNSDTLGVYGTLTSLKVNGNRLQIQTTLDFKPRSTTLADPGRLVVDLIGIRKSNAVKQDFDSTVHLIQYKPNVVRIVVDGATDATLDKLNGPATQNFDDIFRVPIVEPPAQVVVNPALPIPPIDPVPTKPIVPSATGRLEVRVDSESSDLLRLTVPCSQPTMPLVKKLDPSTLQVFLPNVYLSWNSDIRPNTTSIQSIKSEISPAGTSVTLTLSRPMGVDFNQTSDRLHIDLLKPKVGDGKLAGKLIVVDPGHGGKDRGAHAGDVQEKDLNLAIGTLVGNELAKEGATVIMTRKTDVFIPLTDRAVIANRNQADFFISCHINSTGNSRSQSGGITFHHLGRPISRVLAECIQQEIAKVSEIPNLGAWSDQRIYKSGFSVLRQTTMPGVLIEFGFINYSRDRKRLVSDEFQHSVAAAVVKGIKVYLGDANKK